MNQIQALKIARGKFGDRAMVRAGPIPSSPDARQRASARLAELRDSEPKLCPLADWPAEDTVGHYREVMESVKQAHATWRKRRDEQQSLAFYHCFCVGSDEGLFFHVVGQGDTWEEALLKAGCTLPQPKAKAKAKR